MKAWFRAVALVGLLALPIGAQENAPSGVQTGDLLPPLSGVGLDGIPTDLSAVLGGKTVVLSFWSVHCVDCMRELDDLRSIRREFPAEEVAIVAVNIDSGLPVERIAGFVRRYESSRGLTGVTHLLDRGASIVDSLDLTYVPVLIVVSRNGRISSVLTGYSPEDRARMSQALEQGSVALGAWSAGLRGRLRTVLRTPGPRGEIVEWGSFRVEDGMSLFGVHDASGWLFDAAGRRERSTEAQRVEAVVADRLRVLLLSQALASIGVRIPEPGSRPHRPGGLEVPESPFAERGRWEGLYSAIRFDELYRLEQRVGTWLGDDYWAGLVGDVDLAGLRLRLNALDYPTQARRIHLETVSDFDFKVQALLRMLSRNSYRLSLIQGEHLVYYGSAAQLAEELRRLDAAGLDVFVEILSADEIRLEVF